MGAVPCARWEALFLGNLNVTVSTWKEIKNKMKMSSQGLFNYTRWVWVHRSGQKLRKSSKQAGRGLALRESLRQQIAALHCNHNSEHLLNIYKVQGTVLSPLIVLVHLTFPALLWGNSLLFICILSIRKLGRQKFSYVHHILTNW